ncbi:MAG: PAS domain-containing protein [Burkholderiaceae bacterium]
MDIWRAMVEQIAEAVTRANRSFAIERWNTAVAQRFGFSATEAIGRSPDLLIPEQSRAARGRGFDAAIKGGALRLNGRVTPTPFCTSRVAPCTGRRASCWCGAGFDCGSARRPERVECGKSVRSFAPR